MTATQEKKNIRRKNTMNKRYRLYVNGEWYMSSDSEAEINEWANKFWTRDADDYYGNFPDVVVYDTVERREI